MFRTVHIAPNEVLVLYVVNAIIRTMLAARRVPSAKRRPSCATMYGPITVTVGPIQRPPAPPALELAVVEAQPRVFPPPLAVDVADAPQCRLDEAARGAAADAAAKPVTVVDILELPADIFVPARCDIHTPRAACCVSFCLVTVPRCVMRRFCAEALLVLSQASKAAKTLVSRDALYAARRGLQLVVREPSRTPRCRHGFPPGGQLVYEFQRRGGTGHVHTARGTVVLTFSEYILRYVAK